MESNLCTCDHQLLPHDRTEVCPLRPTVERRVAVEWQDLRPWERDIVGGRHSKDLTEEDDRG